MHDAATFFDSPVVASLSTWDRRGFPHVVPIWVVLESDELHMPTSRSTVKVSNVRNDPRVGVMVHEVAGPMDLRGILVRGRARILEGQPALARNREIHSRYLPAQVLQDPEVARYLGGDDVTLIVPLETVTTWDLGKKLSESGDVAASNSVHGG